MQFKDDFRRRSEEEYIKDQGLLIDYDEIARKGKMTKEESLISKWYGVYQSRQPGTHMARIVLAGGKFTAYQGRVMAETARKYANNLLSITTRQAVQLHFLTVENIPEFMRDLNKANLTSYHGCGDVTRTIAACPLAETCIHARTNVLPYAVETAKYLTDARDLDNLPRKFKITFSGCEANCAQPYMNCVGAIAVQTSDEIGKLQTGFKVVIGGGMGWKAFVAQELFSFVPEKSIKELSRAIALFFREHGDRYNRTRSRLKFVVDEQGIEFCREEILKIMKNEKFSTNGFRTESIEYVGTSIPTRPLTVEEPMGADGLITVRALVPKGEIFADQMERLAELSEMYGNQNLYTDNRQNIAIHGIELKNVEKVRSEVEKLGLRTRGSFGLRDIVSCVGKTYCPKAVTFTRDLFDSLLEVMDDEKYDDIEKSGIINITGCPNSCSPFRIADIGLRGMRIRSEESGSVEGYELLIGGSQQQHGMKVGDFKKEDCVTIIKEMLDWFLTDRQGEESIGDFLRKQDIQSVRERVCSEI